MDAPFPNVREVLEEFIVVHKHLCLTDIQRCLIGEAYVWLTHVRDRDKLVLDSPHEFGDVFISFAKHDEGRNCRRVYFNRTVWLMLMTVPFDCRNTEDRSYAGLQQVLLEVQVMQVKRRCETRVAGCRCRCVRPLLEVHWHR